MNSPAGTSTVVARDRPVGVVGPAPLDEHTEIRWARMGVREVVIKAARHPHRSRLRREAELLQRIAADDSAATSVVGFVELTEGADHTELVTFRHGTVTLAEVGLLSPTERAGALTSLCEVLDALHATGWAHGSLEAAHVLVDPDAGNCGVRLCSLGDADQPHGEATDASRSADLQALGVVVLDALETPAGFGTRRERHRYHGAARKAHKRLTAARGLHEGAAVARILRETIGRRTGSGKSTTRQRAGQEQAASARTAGEPRERRPGRSRGWNTWLVTGAIVGCLAAGAAGARALHESGEAPAACTVEITGSSHACGDVTVEGNVVTVAGQRFELGTPRDTVLVGDWDCDGSGTAVLLESATGRLFHFATWSTPSDEVTGTQVGTFEGATGLSDGSPCQYPEVELADGSTVMPLDQSEPTRGEAG